jgi:hypothetical protein
MDVGRQCPACNDGRTVGSGFFYVDLSEVISRERPSSVSECSAVQGSEEFVGEIVSQRTAL